MSPRRASIRSYLALLTLVAMLLDLDRFQFINDSLGHNQGDALLCQIGARLRQCVQPEDTVCRLGGDEFALVLNDPGPGDSLTSLAGQRLERISQSCTIGNHHVTVTASLGISLYPADGGDSISLLRNADLAMYQAKQRGNGFAFYRAEMNRHALKILELENDLRHALERRELLLHYQPKVELARGRIIGCEALLRWQHPQRGLVSPADFIPLAEETGLIVPIGAWALLEACNQAMQWQQQGLPAIGMAVNLSSRQFRSGDLPTAVAAALRHSALPASRLELELTESMVMDDPAGAVQTMQQLKGCGLQLSLDDFGTGYSSLNYLRHFPVDCLKIDASFIRDVDRDPSAAAVVTSIIDIAQNLGLTTIAEGVETHAQLTFLRRCQCDALQGYLYSRPLPAADFAQLLAQPPALAHLAART
ncbi:putative bifunctional diguanylate cyclase/phosphodiesterase [Desulfuromonas thiophila]|uniref:putative bifunctional diguanylate cyclase/phosphodiesterase n=1 Tax=Desulfuromonas thiophila TaxID=57664 RepID=UPI0024A81005|nr:EAL domain-containing protein [Desulfuromonas thiophila]